MNLKCSAGGKLDVIAYEILCFEVTLEGSQQANDNAVILLRCSGNGLLITGRERITPKTTKEANIPSGPIVSLTDLIKNAKPISQSNLAKKSLLPDIFFSDAHGTVLPLQWYCAPLWIPAVALSHSLLQCCEIILSLQLLIGQIWFG